MRIKILIRISKLLRNTCKRKRNEKLRQKSGVLETSSQRNAAAHDKCWREKREEEKGREREENYEKEFSVKNNCSRQPE